jgi:hypothetical protein
LIIDVPTPPTWPEYVATIEEGLTELENELTGAVTEHVPPLALAAEAPQDPIPDELLARVAVLARRLERAAAVVALHMVDVNSRARPTSPSSIPMFIDQRF